MIKVSDKNAMNVYYDKTKYGIVNIISPFMREIKKVFVFSFFINLLTVMIPLFVMFLLDGKVELAFRGNGLINLLILLGLICFNFIFRYMRVSVVNFILQNIDVNICNGILEKVFKIPAKKMERKGESFWHSVFADIDVIRNGLSGSYIMNLFDIPFVLLFVGVIGILLGKYFFVMLFLFLLYLVVVVFANYMLGIVDDKEKLAIKERDELVSNTIHNLSSLKTLSVSDKIMYMWKDYQRSIIDNAYKRNYTLDIFLVISFVVYFVGIVVFALVGEYLYNLNMLSIGALVVILLLYSQSFFLINSFLKYIPQSFKFINSSERLAQVMAEQVDAFKTEVVEDVTIGDLQLKNFTLVDNRKNVILKDVNFTFSDGSVYIVRAKNTFDGAVFLKSLFGGYEGDGGKVVFDRYDVMNLKMDSLKNYIHYAGENAFVIEGTIKENLNCLLSENATDSEFAGFMDYKKVSKALGFDEIVERLPNKYNTIIDAKTDLLSAEELKLLSLVRVFVGNSRVILLDRPFMGLRKKYKENLIALLQKVVDDKIVIVSTHEIDFGRRTVLSLENENITVLSDEMLGVSLQKTEQSEEDDGETHALFKRIFRKK